MKAVGIIRSLRREGGRIAVGAHPSLPLAGRADSAEGRAGWGSNGRVSTPAALICRPVPAPYRLRRAWVPTPTPLGASPRVGPPRRGEGKARPEPCVDQFPQFETSFSYWARCSRCSSAPVCASSAASAVQVGPRRRQARGAALAPRRQRLVEADAAALEGDRAAGQIHEPDPRLDLADLGDRLIVVCEQAVVPEPAGALVVLAPALDVVDLEAVALEALDRVADVVELAARKDVAGQDCELGPFLQEHLVGALRRTGDGMVEEEAVALQHALDGRIVFRVVFPADVLLDADRRHLVELALDRRVVLELDPDLALETEALDLLLRVGDLLLGQRDAVGGDAVMLGRVAGQRAPAAADVEERLAGLEAQLAADDLELVLLHPVDVVVPIRAVGAGVDHLVVEPERIEGVRDVVVIGDVLLVLARVAARGLLGRDRLQRPRSAAVGAPELPRQLRERPFVERLPEVPGAHLVGRAGIGEVEQRSVADVDALRHPQVRQRIEPRT